MKDEKVSVNFSWVPFWIAGWLFTAGANGFSSIPEATTFWEGIKTLLVEYCLWPFFLGALFIK